MHLKTTIAAVSVIGLTALAMTGCSSSGSGDSTAKVSSLTVWHNSADTPAELNLYKNFTKATGIKLNLVSIPADSFETTTQTKWATGDRPDILEYHATRTLLLPLNPTQTMQDLSALPYVKRSGSLYQSSGSVDGKVYAAVTNFPSIFGMYYNKAVFKDAGLQPPTSFADLSSDCVALKKRGVTPIYESGGSSWPTQILSLMYAADLDKGDAWGTSIATNKAKLTDAGGPFLQALTAYKSLQTAGCYNKDYSTGTFPKAISAVSTGKAAMAAFQSDFYSQFTAALGNDATKTSDTIGWVPLSSTSATGVYAPSPIGTFYAPKTGNTARQAAAIKFINYATTGAGYSAFLKDSQQVPIISGFPAPSNLNALQLSYKNAYATSTLAFNSNIAGFGAFNVETGKVLNGQETPAQAATNMQAAVEQASKAAKLPGW